MELTKEYFDKAMENLMANMATQESVVQLENRMATKGDIASIRAEMVTKDELKIQLDQQTRELKQYTTDAFEIQQEWMDERFKELIVVYDVRDRVEKLEREFRDFKLKRPQHA
jgi:activator of HSP90 ATPase